jgi:electron transport complex protein RnfD
MLLAMLLPAAAPWWLVIIGNFLAIVIGKQIFGGIGGNPFNPPALAYAILTLSWKHQLDFSGALASYEFPFPAVFPLEALRSMGTAAIKDFDFINLLLGRQIGGIGATCGLALVLGGIYLMIRGFIRWEIVISFLAGIFVSALLFNIANPARFAGPFFHLLTGYTLIGAFFLVPEDSSSPVNFIPMLIYGATAGVMTMLIRNIGAYPDGVIFAILVSNLINPLIDKIRPKAIGKAAQA